MTRFLLGLLAYLTPAFAFAPSLVLFGLALTPGGDSQ